MVAAPRNCRTATPAHTCCWIVPPGFRRKVASVTNRPVLADRLTVRLFPVPDPTRSVVVVPGERRTARVDTKRPVRALRLTDLAMRMASF